jgi:hypothetical protein
VSDIPDELVLRRHRDLVGRRWHVFVRRGLLILLCAFLVLALANLFGQRPHTTTATAAEAKLSVYGPTHLRSGLYYEARFTIDAQSELKEATLVLDHGWMEGMTINTIEPSPVGEASRDGKLSLTLGHVPAGQSYVLFIQSQVNPTNVGHRSQDVALYDGDQRLTTIHRDVTVFP